jgi:hypothetical protein
MHVCSSTKSINHVTYSCLFDIEASFCWFLLGGEHIRISTVQGLIYFERIIAMLLPLGFQESIYIYIYILNNCFHDQYQKISNSALMC